MFLCIQKVTNEGFIRINYSWRKHPPLSEDFTEWLSLKKSTVWKHRNTGLLWKHLTNTPINVMIKVYFNSDESYWSHISLWFQWKSHLTHASARCNTLIYPEGKYETNLLKEILRVFKLAHKRPPFMYTINKSIYFLTVKILACRGQPYDKISLQAHFKHS